MNRPKLTLMMGNSHSGKSTWVEQNKRNAVVVCPDTIRKVIFGHQFHVEAEEFIWGVTKSMIHILLDQKKDVILDATCLTWGIRQQYWSIASKYLATKEIVWIKTPVDVCLARNLVDKNKQVPEQVIISMDLRQEEAQAGEADIVTVIPYKENKRR